MNYRMPDKMICKICGYSGELMDDKFPGYQSPDLFSIYYCRNCNTSYSIPGRKNDSSIYELIYKNSDSIPGYDRYWSYSKKVKETENPLDFLAAQEEAYWGVKESLRHLVIDKSSAKILEVGSGLGYLTYALRKAGYDSYGLELSEQAVKSAISSYGDYYICYDLFEYSKLHSGIYDIVILTEVIEHLIGPIEFIEHIVTLLKPDGKIILTTPNKTLYPNNIIWNTELPPVHYWWFSEKSMVFLADKITLTIDFIDFTEFYKKNIKTVSLGEIGNHKNPVFDENGVLLFKKSTVEKSNFGKLKNYLFKIPYLKRLYLNIRSWFDPNLIIAGKTGIILCATFSKK
jgi:2-polyprenyl-3-methyl-5-hydroxy-6-metoxy-1,4-benzoquinol methylase